MRTATGRKYTGKTNNYQPKKSLTPVDSEIWTDSEFKSDSDSESENVHTTDY